MLREMMVAGLGAKRPSDPRWKHRRRLVYGTFVLALVMIGVAAFDGSDRQVSSELVVGGVALLSIILSAYVGFATVDDRWQQPPKEDLPDESSHLYP